MTTTDTRIAKARKIAEALTGLHTEPGKYGHYLLTAKVWVKGDKVRIYVDRRFVEDGRINSRVEGSGYLDMIGTEIVYDLKLVAGDVRRVVEAI